MFRIGRGLYSLKSGKHRRRALGGSISFLIPSSLAFLFILSLLTPVGQVQAGVSTGIITGQTPMENLTLRFGAEGGFDPSLSLPVKGGGMIQDIELHLKTVEDRIRPQRVYVDVGLDGREEWSFGGGEFGSFGLQNSFSNGETIHRMDSDSTSWEGSFLIPVGAKDLDPNIEIWTQPLPKMAGPPADTGIRVNDIDPDMMDVADLDGDGFEDIAFYLPEEGKVKCYLAGSMGSGSVHTLATNVHNLTLLRTVTSAGGREGGVVIAYSNDGIEQSVDIVLGNLRTDPRRIEIADGLDPDTKPFFIQNGADITSGSFVSLASGSGRILQIDLPSNGTLIKNTLMDRSINANAIGQADMDGDGDLDIIVMPAPGNNLTFYKAHGLSGSLVYSVVDSGLSPNCSGHGAVIDTDGDGSDEFYYRDDKGNVQGIRMTSQGKFKMILLGDGNVSGYPATIPTSSYGKDTLYSGGEGFLYISQGDGISAAFPEKDMDGSHHVRTLDGFGTYPVLGSQSQNESRIAYYIDSSGMIKVASLEWWGSDGITLENPWSGARIKFEPDATSKKTVNITRVIDRANTIYNTTDESGNTFIRYDLKLTGDRGIVGFGGLSVEYMIDLDASVSDDFIRAASNAKENSLDDNVHFGVGADSEGWLVVGPAVVEHDIPPTLIRDIPEGISIDEDQEETLILESSLYIRDDYRSSAELDYRLITGPEVPPGLIRVEEDGSVICDPSFYPDLNGDFNFGLLVEDDHSSLTIGPIEVRVTPVEDGPRMISRLSPLTIKEGDLTTLELGGDNGTGPFMDPDGDTLYFSYDLVSSTPPGIESKTMIEIENGILFIEPSVHGEGGEISLRIRCSDQKSGRDIITMLEITIINTDSSLSIDSNPGPVYVLEDQESPTRVPLEGWFTDPDTPLLAYDIAVYSSDEKLKAYHANFQQRAYLMLLPTGDLNGNHKVWVEISSGDISINDMIDVMIEPVNDRPEVNIDSTKEIEEEGWMIKGSSVDPDSDNGEVQYRVGDGLWREAIGWRSWSFFVPYSDLKPQGSYIFVRGTDGDVFSEEIYTKVRPDNEGGTITIDTDGDGVPDVFDSFPDDPTEQYDTDGDGFGDNIDKFPYDQSEWMDSDGDGVGDNEDEAPFNPDFPGDNEEYSPSPQNDRSDGGLISWILMGGAGFSLMGLLIFMTTTEIGMIITGTMASQIYSKLNRKDVLNHEIRGLIRGYIIANPGDHYSSIKRNLDLNNGTLAYHLRVLEQNDIVKSMYDGIYKRYYPANVNINKVKKNISKQEEIFHTIIENPGVTMEEIARSIGSSRQVVNYHVKNLIRAGFVTYRRDKKSAKFYSADEGGNGHE